MAENNKDILKAEGVLEKGFGIISKTVMQDKNLGYGAKCLYAYLSSYTGAGATAYPGRDKILYDLHMAKNTYCKYISELKEAGYLKVEQSRNGANFGHNIYTIIIKPEHGYGIIPKSVMTNRDLSIQAKTIYAYCCSSMPIGTAMGYDNEKTLYYLNMSLSTYLKHERMLKNKNLIKKERPSIGGQFTKQKTIIIFSPEN